MLAAAPRRLGYGPDRFPEGSGSSMIVGYPGREATIWRR
jgi:hypothetical protein